MFGFRDPIGAETDLVELLGVNRRQSGNKSPQNHGQSGHILTLSLPSPKGQAASGTL
jgi:hypothetical protein